MGLHEKRRRRRKFYDFYRENAQFKHFSIFVKTNVWFSKNPDGGFKTLKPPMATPLNPLPESPGKGPPQLFVTPYTLRMNGPYVFLP